MQFRFFSFVLLILLFAGPLLASGSNGTSNPVNASSTCAEPVNTVPDFKRTNARRVFQSLKKAVGLSPSDPPSFELVDALSGPFSSAMISYREQKIYLEEAAYDICTTFFGADSLDALASYLAHELAHFRSNHEVKNHYTKEFKDDIYKTNMPRLNRSLPQQTKNEVILLLFNSLTATTEAEADLDGGFLAYLAGYKTIGLGEQLLQRTYDTFNIDPTPPNQDYPTLEERKAIVRETEKELSTLIDLFETANLLTAIGQYDEALVCQQAILRKFQSREIYNNIGVLYSLAFLDKVNPAKIKYAFPIELDLDSRLNATKNIGREDISVLIKAAIEHFQSAINKDPNYTTGYLNLANASCLSAIISTDNLVREQQLALAEAYALSALVLSKQKEVSTNTKANIEITRGIIKAIQSETEQAKKFFNAALQLIPDYQLAKNNLSFLDGETPVKTFDPNNLVQNNPEKIENKSIARIKVSLIYHDSTQNNAVRTRIYTDNKNMRGANLKHSKLLTYRINEKAGLTEKERILSFHLTNSDPRANLSTEKGITLNDQRTKITAEAAYGKPGKEIQTAQGTWLVYPNYNMIFELDEAQKLRRWCVYSLKL